ncbi:DMT family transporter [Rubritalea squalenifaciens]|nr:DMT family transporter [Rubritalea squalenifaciens]
MTSASSHSTSSKAPMLQLHWLVVIVAFTAILGHLISLPASTLVVWRTAIAAIILFILIRPKVARDAHPFKLKATLTGIILGAHWMTFFGAIKLSNISICLTGLATLSLFTSITEAIQERRKPYFSEILLGAVVIPSMALIVGVEKGELAGILTALASALLAAIFTVINKHLVRQGTPPAAITQYEMLGACLTCLVTSLAMGLPIESYLPSQGDWLWLGLLATVCTVYAFSLNVKLLGHFSAFEANLAINFEPVYGILLAAVLFQEHKDLHPLFFVGTLLIVLANFAKPIIRRLRTIGTLRKNRPSVN